MMKIGFFGDSFCSRSDDGTYIKKLKDYYNAEIVNLGIGGSSIEDSIILQFLPLISYCPDICIFTWTDMFRLFHRSIRNINIGSAIHHRSENKSDTNVWDAASQYYNHLLDYENIKLKYCALLYYFDHVILSKLPIGTKIIHLWSFREEDDQGNEFYMYRFSNGIEIRPALVSISSDGKSIMQLRYDNAPNHFDSEHKNQLVFERIKSAIDNYESGRLIDYSI